MTTESPVNTEKLVQDLKAVIVDAEELLRATASQAGEHVAAARVVFDHDKRNNHHAGVCEEAAIVGSGSVKHIDR